MSNLGGPMSSPCTRDAPLTQTNRTRAEHRSEPRYNCPRLVRIRPVTVPESSFRLAHVKNVSSHGIGLLLTNAVAPGTQLEIEAQGRCAIKRVARVVHSTKQEGGWLVGCTLDNSLSDAELDRLLN